MAPWIASRALESTNSQGLSRPQCQECQEDLAIEHFLISCPQYENLRIELFSSYDNLYVLFSTPAPIHIIRFLKRVGIFYDI